MICAGYKQHIIKQWFADYYLHNSDITFDFSEDGKMLVHKNITEPWRVTIVDTGLNTMTGGRIRRIQPYTKGDPFFLTYGDGVSNIDIDKLLSFHREHGKCVTISTVNIAQQKGILDVDDNNTIQAFREKDDSDGALINAGFMVCNPEVFNYIEGDQTVFEKTPMQRLAAEGNLKSYFHSGFWQCMDTKREKDKLEELWVSGRSPWKVWDD